MALISVACIGDVRMRHLPSGAYWEVGIIRNIKKSEIFLKN
jgi:hypothetical protein